MIEEFRIKAYFEFAKIVIKGEEYSLENKLILLEYIRQKIDCIKKGSLN